MKTKTMFLVGALGLLALTSCKKDWVCDCAITAGGQTANTKNEIKNVSKSDAEEWCDGQEMNAFYSCSLSAK